MMQLELATLLELKHKANGLSLHSTRHMRTPLSGLYASVFRGQGMDFEEVREYCYGDEIRHIDWRVTARMQKTYLKVYREERERQVLLCVDMSLGMQFGTRHTFKHIQAAQIAALLGWSGLIHGDKVGGLVFTQQALQFFRPERSQRSFLQLLKQLSQPIDLLSSEKSNENTLDLLKALHSLNQSSHTGALLFIIADFLNLETKALQRALAELQQRHEVVLIHLNDPADMQLPAMGIVCFVTPEGKELYVDTNNAKGRKTYTDLWQQQYDYFKQMAQRLKIHCLTIATNEDAHLTLIRELTKIMRKI